MKQLLWVALVLSMLAALPAASGIGSITVDSVVNPDSTVHTTMTVRFDSPVASFSHPLHSGIVDLEASGDFEKADCRVIPRTVASEIYCDLVGITPERNILTLEFNTLDSVRKVDATYLYTITFGVSTPTNDSFIIVRLPESGVLAADIPNQSYSPQDGSVFSDGRHIGIFWQRDRLNPGDSLQFSVNYRVSEQAGALSQFLIVVAVVAMIIAAGAVVYFRQGRFR
ncbi:MAG: hypothetical protein HY367_00675, partial [Candidatus Aenigmarchaeota archaeon]|nr:hypothetical protein [Candidatus Aenigmarchaeota archaeon]